jgi:hypothetical protein
MEPERPPAQELNEAHPRWINTVVTTLAPIAALIGAIAALITAVRS